MLCFFHQEFFTKSTIFGPELNIFGLSQVGYFFKHICPGFILTRYKYLNFTLLNIFSDPLSILSNSLKFVFIFREDPTPTSEIG